MFVQCKALHPHASEAGAFAPTTDKCSFLDGETVEHHDRYVGKRIKRGLFVASTGQTIHADLTLRVG